MDDDAWVRRLREVVSSGVEDLEQVVAPPPAPAQTVPTAEADLVHAVRALQGEVAAVRSELAGVRAQQARLAEEVADAVIDRLDQRWARAIDEPPSDATSATARSAGTTGRPEAAPGTFRDQLDRAKAYTARRLAQ